MNDAADLLRFFFFHDAERIGRRLPAVNNHRKFFFPSKRNLTAEPVFLLLMILLVPVIVKANLTDRDRLFHAAEFPHPRHHVLVQIAHLIRVKAERAVDERIRFHQFSCIFQ